jgi:hypothetical protein
VGYNTYETRQEVTTVLTYINQRPSALPAVRAQESTLLVAPATVAHVIVGSPAVRNARTGSALIQTPQNQRLQGTTVFTVKAVFTVKDRGAVMDPVSGVRGIPPRGRPV